MKFWSDEIKDGAYIPTKYAAGAANLKGFAPNLNPPLAWSEVPEGVQSFVLICHDPDAPSTMEDVNKPDREVPAATPRANFYHWLLIDLPATLRQIKEGEFCNGFTVQGKAGPEAAKGSTTTPTGLQETPKWRANTSVMMAPTRLATIQSCTATFFHCTHWLCPNSIWLPTRLTARSSWWHWPNCNPRGACWHCRHSGAPTPPIPGCSPDQAPYTVQSPVTEKHRYFDEHAAKHYPYPGHTPW